MKTVIAYGKYVVSFNCNVNKIEVGDSSEHSLDFAGDNIEQLALEVIADDPKFPMVFIEQDESQQVCGLFVEAKNHENVVAVMVPFDKF